MKTWSLRSRSTGVDAGSSGCPERTFRRRGPGLCAGGAGRPDCREGANRTVSRQLLRRDGLKEGPLAGVRRIFSASPMSVARPRRHFGRQPFHPVSSGTPSTGYSCMCLRLYLARRPEPSKAPVRTRKIRIVTYSGRDGGIAAEVLRFRACEAAAAARLNPGRS